MCKECKFGANSNLSQLIQIPVYNIFRRLVTLGKARNMSRQHVQVPVSSPRLLASAIGMALTATSVVQLAHAAENTDAKTTGKSIALDATSITGEAQETPSYQVQKASSPKYTAP